MSLALLFVLPWRSVVTIGNTVTIGWVVGCLFGLSWVALVFRRKTIRGPHLFHVTIFLLFCWTSLSMIWSINTSNTVIDAIRLLYIFFVLVAIWDIHYTLERVLIGLQTFLFALCILLVGAFADVLFITMEVYDSFYGSRASPFGLNPNNVGSALVLGVPIAYFLNIYELVERRSLRYLNYSFVVLGPVGILLTGSRGAIATVFALLVFMTFRVPSRKTIRTTVLSFAVFLSIIVSLLLLLPTRLINRVLSIIEAIRALDLDNRGDIWMEGMQYFWEQPIHGVGSGNFSILVGLTAHNQYLTVLVELGLVGLFLFSYALLIVFREGLRANEIQSLWICITVGYLLILIFNDMAFITGLILMGIVVAGVFSSSTRPNQAPN